MKTKNSNQEKDKQPPSLKKLQPFFNECHLNQLLIPHPSKSKQTIVRQKSQDSGQLKIKLNWFMQQNKKLRTANTYLKSQSCKLQKVAKQFQKYVQKNSLSSQNSVLLLLRKQIVKLKQQLNETKRELTQKRKLIEVTSKTQVEIQMKNFIAETIRLKAIIKSIIKPEQQSIHDHLVQALRQQLQESKGKLRQSQYDRDNINSKLKLQAKETQSLRFKLSKLQNQLHYKNAVIQKLQYQNKAVFVRKCNDQRSLILNKDQERIRQLQSQISKLKAENAALQDKFMLEHKASQQFKQSFRERESKNLDAMSKLKAEVSMLRELLDSLQTDSQPQLKPSFSISQNKKASPHQPQPQLSQPVKKKKPVKQSEVRSILKLTNGVDLVNFFKGKQMMTLDDIKEGFELLDLGREQVDTLIRYLCEDGGVIDQMQVVNTAYLNSALRRLTQ